MGVAKVMAVVRNKLVLLCAVLATTAWSAKQLEECSTSCKYVGNIYTDMEQSIIHSKNTSTMSIYMPAVPR